MNRAAGANYRLESFMTTTIGPRGLWATLGMMGLLVGCGGPTGPQICDGRLAGDLVITEFMANPSSTDDGKEYIELYNATGDDLELKGMTLYVSKSDGTAQKTHQFTVGTIPAGAFFVAGDIRDGAELPEWIDYSYDSTLGGLPNTGGIIGIRCGPTKLDEVVYEGTKENAARVFGSGVNPDAAANDDLTKWCDSKVEFASGANGSPGLPNENCPVEGQCRDVATGTSRVAVKPAPGDLVITEVMNNPTTEDDQEWFEVLALNDFDLDGLLVGNQNAASVADASALDANPDGTCQRVTAGTYAVIANSRDTTVNGGLTTVAATFASPALTNQNNSRVTLYLPDGTVLDAATFNAGTDGKSWQLDPDAGLDTTLNDSPSAFCASSASYGSSGNFGTPGAPNGSCSGTVPTNTCSDGGTVRDIVFPVAGDLVITEFMSDPKAPDQTGTETVSDSNGEWVELYATVAVDLNGLLVTDSTGAGAPLNRPECVRLNAGEYAVFARKLDSGMNGGVTAVATFSVSLNQDSDSIAVKRDGVELARLDYSIASPSTKAGTAWQLSASKLTSSQPHTFSADFCAADSEYGPGGTGITRDKGTPGSANATCP